MNPSVMAGCASAPNPEYKVTSPSFLAASTILSHSAGAAGDGAGAVGGVGTGGASFLAQASGVLISAVLLWDILYRSQLGVSLMFFEEMYARNLGHLFVSPLRPIEMVAALLTEGTERFDAIALNERLDSLGAALQHYGQWFGPYPYGHITVVDPAYGSASAKLLASWTM